MPLDQTATWPPLGEQQREYFELPKAAERSRERGEQPKAPGGDESIGSL